MVGELKNSLEIFTSRETVKEDRIIELEDELYNTSLQKQKLEMASETINRQQQNSGINSLETI